MCEIKPTDKMNKLRATTETHTRTPPCPVKVKASTSSASLRISTPS